jgi:hypothetical protein
MYVHTAIDSSNTLQQQSVGAKGSARNFGMRGNQSEPHEQQGMNNNQQETRPWLSKNLSIKRKS